jgi:hypothetical protein
VQPSAAAASLIAKSPRLGEVVFVHVNERAGLRYEVKPPLIQREAQVGLAIGVAKLTDGLQVGNRLAFAKVSDPRRGRRYQTSSTSR